LAQVFALFNRIVRSYSLSIDVQQPFDGANNMANVLVIESSARQQGSVSRQLTAQFIANWSAANPVDQIKVRDLAVDQVPHLDANLLGGWMTPAAQQSDAEQAALALSNLLTDELLAADVLVLAAPMYNFAIPSTLKAWLDHVLRAGVTFKYTETGPQGLLSGKRAFVLTARGGIYAGGTQDHQEPYLRQALAFVGIHDVSFIHAEGLNLGGEFMEKGLNQAKAQLAQAI
jgi:FMN-dependent NADH-azoreductase